MTHRLLAHRLAGHDEGATHIAVLHETFAIGLAQLLRQLHGRRTARLGDRDDHIDFGRRHGRDHALSQGLAHFQASLVNRHAIDHGVWTSQIHVLEHAGVEHGIVSTHLCVHHTVEVDEKRFARLHIAHEAVAGAFQGHRLAGHHHLAAFGQIGLAIAHGSNAKWITECHHAIPRNQTDHGIRALDALVHGAHSLEDRCRRQGQFTACQFELVRKHVEQHFSVAIGVEVATIDVEQLFAQGVGVGQVAVVNQDQAKWRVHVERLRLFFVERIACGGITHLTQTNRARQSAHVTRAEHIFDHATGLVHEELASVCIGACRHDTGCILTTVLQQQQRVIDQLVDWRLGNHSDDAAHGSPLQNKSQKLSGLLGQEFDHLLGQDGGQAPQ